MAPKLPQYHVLNFLHDKDFGCALTARVNGAWYHVMADSKRLNDRSKRGKRISRAYRRLLGEVKAAEGAEEGEGTAPLFVQEDETVSGSDDGERDSAVDVSTPTEEHEEEEHEGTPGSALERWMLRPLIDTFSKNAPKQQDTERTVQEWYRCPKYYFDLCVKDGKLQAEEDRTPTLHLQKRLEHLVPSMPLPKYIRNLEIPSIEAKNLTVLDESSNPAPIHPTRVRHADGKEYFLKLVDPDQHQPTKREIQVMKRIESEGLQNELRVPLLQGLVHFSDESKNNIMGFIMDAIDDPTPLTLLIDTDVDEIKRLSWAEESARMVDVLHQHGIIWGDAKGDNFMVDANDELWIIDFGGSYTEGWVDPELKETEEGDDMGVRKICNGLEDPENNTIKEGEEEEREAMAEAEEEQDNGEEAGTEVDEEEPAVESKPSKPGSKRKAEDTAGPGNNESKSHKQQKKGSISESNGAVTSVPLYCYCNKPSSGKMIACDGKECERQWFHFACVGLDDAPPERKWYCEECQGNE